MNVRKSFVLMAVSLMIECGCDKGGADVPCAEEPIAVGEVASGGKITIEKKTAERSCVFKIGGKDRTVSFTASMEYPMHFGIPKHEYRNLTGLVDEMFNNGTNFETSVEIVFTNLVESVRNLSTNKLVKVEENYSLTADGKMVFADERYFSYKLQVVGGEGDDLRTYDRKLGRTIILIDLVATNDFDVICKQVREYVKLGLGPLYNVQDEKSFDQQTERALLKKLSDFTVDQHGLMFYFKKDEWHLGLNMEVRVGWDSIEDVLIDKSLIPTGKFNEKVVHVIDENDPEWWRFPIEKYEYGVLEPPKFLWEGTNYPYAGICHEIEIPGQGNIHKEKYDIFQSALGAFISHGKKPHNTIKEAVYRETVKFWTGHIDEHKKRPQDAFGIYELNSHIPYRGPEYVSYCLSEQNGPPGGTIYSNFVWDWRTMRQLKIEEVIDMGKRRQLWEMIRNDVSKDDDNFEWPEWAKDWPTDMTNFWLDRDGVNWGYWAGEIFAGCNGHMTISLTWEELSAILRKDFIVPTK
jgi:hypothetical protein